MLVLAPLATLAVCYILLRNAANPVKGENDVNGKALQDTRPYNIQIL